MQLRRRLLTARRWLPAGAPAEWGSASAAVRNELDRLHFEHGVGDSGSVSAGAMAAWAAGWGSGGWVPAPVSGDERDAAARALRDALLELPEELFRNVLMCL